MPAVPRYLYLIGGLYLRTPMGLNIQDIVEEFGGDYAVKPLVGARQTREAMGPSDHRFIMSGTIFPFRFAAMGGSSGLSEIDQLRRYAEQQVSLPVSRSDGVNLPDFWLIEKGSVHHSKLAKQGIGRVQEVTFSMVRTTQGPSPDQAIRMFQAFVTLFTSVAGATATTTNPAAPVPPPFPPQSTFNT